MHIKHNPITKVVLKPIIVTAEWYGKHYPLSYMKIRYFARFHKMVNLQNPKDLNEKIQWLAFYTDTSEWSRLADKFAVRNFVKEKGLENILVPLYGKWYDAKQVDVKSLPKSFVLKTNNGCGTVLIVSDKDKIDEAFIKRKLDKWMHESDVGFELHYRRIKPCIIAEGLLPLPKDATSLVDYKIWCFNGEPYTILTCSNRMKVGTHLGCYDLHWNYHPENLKTSKTYPLEKMPLSKPNNLDKMIDIARKLAYGFPQVRVDLYNIEGNIYFGEMTFTSLGGLMDYYTPEFLLQMGQQIDLNYKG